MRLRRFSPLHLILALLTLAAFVLVGVERLGLAPGLQPAMALLYQWLMLLGGVALLVGAVNVVWLHLRRIQQGQQEWMLSLVLLAVLLPTFVAGIVNPAGARSPLLQWVFDSVVAPGQAALFALLIFFMAAATYRFLRVGRAGGAWLLVGALLVIAVQMPAATAWLPAGWVDATFWFVDAPVTAAVRGLLLGSALAMLVAGLRLLLGRA